MRYLEIVLIVGFLLSGEGAFGMQLQWDVRMNRKLLLEGGTETKDKADKMYVVTVGSKTYTGIALKNKMIAIPAGTAKSATIGGKSLTSKGSKGGFSFFTGGPIASSAFGEYYTGTAEPKDCYVHGYKDGKTVKEPATIDKFSAKKISLKDPLMCESDLGAALVCGGKLTGIIEGTGEGAGLVPTSTPPGTTGTEASNTPGGTPAPTNRAEPPGGRQEPSASSSASTATSGGSTTAGVSQSTSKKVRRKRDPNETSTTTSSTTSGECTQPYGAMNIKEIQNLVSKAVASATYASVVTVITIAIMGLIVCLN